MSYIHFFKFFVNSYKYVFIFFLLCLPQLRLLHCAAAAAPPWIESKLHTYIYGRTDGCMYVAAPRPCACILYYIVDRLLPLFFVSLSPSNFFFCFRYRVPFSSVSRVKKGKKGAETRRHNVKINFFKINLLKWQQDFKNLFKWQKD